MCNKNSSDAKNDVFCLNLGYTQLPTELILVLLEMKKRYTVMLGKKCCPQLSYF